MDRVRTYSVNSLVQAADLNKIQDNAHSVRRAAQDAELTAWDPTSSGVIFQQGLTQIAAGSGITLDDKIDWRNRLVEGWIATPGSSTQRINGANAYNINVAFESRKQFVGFLGTGSTTSFGATDYFAKADWDGVTWTWNLYADPSTGALKIWNRSGAAARFLIRVLSIGSET